MVIIETADVARLTLNYQKTLFETVEYTSIQLSVTVSIRSSSLFLLRHGHKRINQPNILRPFKHSFPNRIHPIEIATVFTLEISFLGIVALGLLRPTVELHSTHDEPMDFIGSIRQRKRTLTGVHFCQWRPLSKPRCVMELNRLADDVAHA